MYIKCFKRINNYAGVFFAAPCSGKLIGHVCVRPFPNHDALLPDLNINMRFSILLPLLFHYHCNYCYNYSILCYSDLQKLKTSLATLAEGRAINNEKPTRST